MRRRHPFVATALATCLALSTSLNPSFAGGLIPTERLLAPNQSATVAPTTASDPQMQRQELHTALIAAGVDSSFAQQRLAVLSDAEIGRLMHDLHTAPAGGLWFMPFLVVAAVIGVLISVSRSAEGPRTVPATDLFGRPSRNIAVGP